MARVEIEEADLVGLRHIHNVVDSILAQPETRASFLKVAKQANPKLPIPEVDAAQPVMDAVGAVNKKLDDFLTAQSERERKAQEDASVASLRASWRREEDALRAAGWRSAGIDAVKKFAEDNGISDLGIAADAYERRNPQPAPERSAGAGWNLFSGPEQEDTFIPDMMKSGGEDSGRLDREIRDTLTQMRSAR